MRTRQVLPDCILPLNIEAAKLTGIANIFAVHDFDHGHLLK